MSTRLVVAAWFLASALGATAMARQGEGADGFRPITFGDAGELAYTLPFFPGMTYDPSLPSPDAIIGAVQGSRLSTHAEILECFRRWAASSNRMKLERYGLTHEGRELCVAMISAPQNLARWNEIERDLGRLADPRELGDAEAEAVLARTPAIAWLGYSIHGDELSGCDAAVALAYHLLAGQDPALLELLQNVVIVIDPCLNPDGRERILAQVRQGTGHVPNLDYDSMQRGRWPWGRGNHYLFDMNRDWMAGTQPETRGRWRMGLRFHPQLFVDAHEMGSLDTYLFYPQAPPQNPHLPTTLARWQKEFSLDQARAFDAYGWGYYTREWADAWGPFYSDSWGSLNGAVGILYEQANTSGVALRRASGRILTYREAVHHHAVSSLANVTTLGRRRAEILRDYLAERRRNVAASTPGNERMLVVVPGSNRAREDAFVAILLDQGIEVSRASVAFAAQHVEDTLGHRDETREMPAASLVIAARQPQAPLVKSYLQFDLRIDAQSLAAERHELEWKGQTRMYDATAWSLPLAFALDASWCDAKDVPGTRITGVEPRAGQVSADAREPAARVAWVVDGGDDASLRFAARALASGIAVHVAEEAFQTGGREFPRGSFLVRASENASDVQEVVNKIALAARVAVFATASGRSPADGPDLGGQKFHLLARPRVALIGNAPISADDYGHVWHLLDVEIGVPVSSLDASALGNYDLRRYNVIVVPPAAGELASVIAANAPALRAWVQAGGTLIACGNAAAALTDAKLDLTQVRLRQDVLEHLADYQFAAQREIASRKIEIDASKVWGDAMPAPASKASEAQATATPSTSAAVANAIDAKAKPDASHDPDAKREDEWLRRFAPAGVFLHALIDRQHWITAGCRDEMPVYCAGANAFLARGPVQTPIRLASADQLRIAGLVWPEARERLALSAYLTVERSGNGQVILFATPPAFRGVMRATARLLGNAVICGPGLGASQPNGW